MLNKKKKTKESRQSWVQKYGLFCQKLNIKKTESQDLAPEQRKCASLYTNLDTQVWGWSVECEDGVCVWYLLSVECEYGVRSVRMECGVCVVFVDGGVWGWSVCGVRGVQSAESAVLVPSHLAVSQHTWSIDYYCKWFPWTSLDSCSTFSGWHQYCLDTLVFCSVRDWHWHDSLQAQSWAILSLIKNTTF